MVISVQYYAYYVVNSVQYYAYYLVNPVQYHPYYAVNPVQYHAYYLLRHISSQYSLTSFGPCCYSCCEWNKSKRNNRGAGKGR